MRQRADRERIRGFLSQLSQRFRGAARLYLVGGTTLVYEGFRQQSLDVDIVMEVSDAQHSNLVQAIRGLKDELSINVEEASPADFIPLPAGYEGRHQFVERFGSIDVYHFDLYSVGLSKVERGRAQDFEDVLSLLRAGRLEWQKLVECYNDILPRMGQTSLKQDPSRLARHFDLLKSMVA